MLMVIDNYDSFTYNLVQVLGELGEEMVVFRNDELDVAEVKRLKPRSIVISPGPGRPEDAGIIMPLIAEVGPEIPILGVCLGHQAIAAVYGAQVVRANQIMHGKGSRIYHHGRNLYQGMDNPFFAIRYHSLVVDPASLPDCLEVTAYTADGLIMGIRHKDYLVEGVQFHPESFLTVQGRQLLKNFLELSRVQSGAVKT